MPNQQLIEYIKQARATIAVIAIAAILFIGGGWFVYRYFIHQPEKQYIPSWSSMEAPLLNGIYTNERFRYRVQVPNGWRLSPQMSIFDKSLEIVMDRHKTDRDSDFDEFLDDELPKLSQERVDEILRLIMSWEPKKMETVIFTVISLEEEEMLMKNGEWPQHRIIKIFADKPTFNIGKVEDKDIGFLLVKKMSTQEGVQGIYLLHKDTAHGSAFRPQTFAVETKFSIPLANEEMLGNIIIESSGMAEEEFLAFVRSLELF